MAAHRFQLNVNGKSHRVDVDGNMPLPWVLRDILGLTGTKFGGGVAQGGGPVGGAGRRAAVQRAAGQIRDQVVGRNGLGRAGPGWGVDVPIDHQTVGQVLVRVGGHGSIGLSLVRGRRVAPFRDPFHGILIFPVAAPAFHDLRRGGRDELAEKQQPGGEFARSDALLSGLPATTAVKVCG